MKQGTEYFLGATLALFAVAAIIITIAFSFGRGAGLFSIVGEEGFTPYDDFGTGVIEGLACGGGECSSAEWRFIGAQQTPYSMHNDEMQVAWFDAQFGATGSSGHTLTLLTRNLHDADFKVDYRTNAILNGDGGSYGNPVKAVVYENGVPVKIHALTPAIDKLLSTSGTLEVYANDYESGGYRVVVGGEEIHTGFTSDLRVGFLAEEVWPNSNYATLKLSNPRWRLLWGCDPQEGEMLGWWPFDGPQTVTLNDLDSECSFERFCVDMDAVHYDNGIAAPSNQVYYTLAEGGAVPIGQGESWAFWWIGRCNDLRTDEVGFGHLDDPFITEDHNDLIIPESEVSGTTLWWTSSGSRERWNVASKKLDLYSGEEVFLKTHFPNDDECTYNTDEWVQDDDCFAMELLGLRFRPGAEFLYGPVTITLLDLQTYSMIEDSREKLDFAASWKLDFPPDAITVTTTTPPSLLLDEQSNALVTIANHLAGPVSVILTASSQRDATGLVTSEHYEVVLPPNSDTSLTTPLATDTIGRVTLSLQPTIKTSAGNIAQRSTVLTYGVAAEPSDLPDAADDAELRWWERLWLWIKRLFGVTT